MSTALQHLFDLYCLTASEKQHRLAALTGRLEGRLDMEAGTLMFGFEYAFPVQALGREAMDSKTWLWAWADLDSEIPAEYLPTANSLWEYGERYEIEPLTTGNLLLEPVDGHYLALIASGIGRASGYFRSPTDDGAVFVLIKAKVIDRMPGWTGEELTAAMQDLIARYRFNHKTALMAYCTAYNLDVQEIGSEGTAYTLTGEKVAVRLDEDLCLAEMAVT